MALSGMALVSLPFAASAQVSSVRPFQIGIAAGAALPMDELKDITDLGFNVTGTIGFHPALIPVGIRVDVAYNSFGIKDDLGVDGNVHFTSVTGNLVWSIPSAAVSPYFIGGAGLYNAAIDVPGFEDESDNKFGFNIGGGIKMALSGFDTFLEARYNQVQGNDGSLKFIPITFGLMF
jgi:opacity protein-like surface antigen